MIVVVCVLLLGVRRCCLLLWGVPISRLSRRVLVVVVSSLVLV